MAQSRDTTQEARQAQLRAFRSMDPAQRVAIALKMSEQLLAMSAARTERLRVPGPRAEHT